jgi:hypothetical protein
MAMAMSNDAQSTTTTADAVTMPTEVLLHIMGFLGPRELCAVSSVDSYCRDVASDPSLWRRLSRDKKHPRAPSSVHPKEWYRRMEARIELRVCSVRAHKTKPSGELLMRSGRWSSVFVERDAGLHQLIHAVAASTSLAPRLLRLWKPCAMGDDDRYGMLVPLGAGDDRRKPGIVSAYDLKHGSEVVYAGVGPGQEHHLEEVCTTRERNRIALPL